MEALTTDWIIRPEETAREGGAAQKNAAIRQAIVASLAAAGERTLADLAAELRVSIPTATKLVAELVAQGVVADRGKVETAGGRRPNVFGLCGEAAFFAGVAVRADSLRMVAVDLCGEVMYDRLEEPVTAVEGQPAPEALCDRIEAFLESTGVERAKWFGMGVCLEADAEETAGYAQFASADELRERVERRFGIRTLVESEVRARCYAEFCMEGRRERDMLYLYLDRGVAVGIMADGRLYGGRSGYAGTFGHVPFFENGALCVCGRKGCLETAAAGWAIERKMDEALAAGANSLLRERHAAGEPLRLADIAAAARGGDSLSIELVGQAGEQIGRGVALLLSLFNPASVVVGGTLASAGDYLMLPLLAATNRYTLNRIYKDTQFRLGRMGMEAGPTGAALLIRNRIIGLD